MPETYFLDRCWLRTDLGEERPDVEIKLDDPDLVVAAMSDAEAERKLAARGRALVWWMGFPDHQKVVASMCVATPNGGNVCRLVTF